MQLSEKELLMVSESLMGHFGTVQKFRGFSQSCQDQEVKQLLDTHASKMERHGQELMQMVQSSGSTGTVGYPQYTQSHQPGGSQYTPSHQYSGSQYTTSQQYGDSQYGTPKYGTIQQGTQYGQYGTQPGVSSPGQYGFTSPSQQGTQYGQYRTQPGVSSPNQQGFSSQSFGSQGQYSTEYGQGSQSQPYQQSRQNQQSQYGQYGTQQGQQNQQKY